MPTTISYIIPTRNRPRDLLRTLEGIAAMGPQDAEVIIVDNASATRPHVPATLGSGVPVGVIHRAQNDGAAARNAGARIAAGEWVVMLDDDSHPTCDAATLTAILERTPAITGAVMADIKLPGQAAGPGHPRREAGGLPEVFIGCGVAMRRQVLIDLGGYDAAFGFYAEEYDLAARVLLEGMRVSFEPRFTVDHHKVTTGRDMDLILHRLVRNNGWVMQRYAPERRRRAELREVRSRYRGIAVKERAMAGYARGLVELRSTIRQQARLPMTDAVFARFTGLAAARQALEVGLAGLHARTAAIVDEGKNASVIREALRERGVRVLDGTASAAEADIAVIGTMSPGPMIDAAIRRRAEIDAGRVILPWTTAGLVVSGARIPLRLGVRALPAA